MNRYRLIARISGVVLLLALTVGIAVAQGPQPQSAQDTLGTVFTYRGQLKKNNAPVNASCNMTFSLWDTPNGNTQIGSNQVINLVAVTNGQFTVQLNGAGEFGPDAFNGQDRWLQTTVQCANDTSPTTLSRQQLTAVPYGLHAVNSSSTTALQGRAINAAAPAAGEVLKWNGTEWGPASDNVGGGTSGWLVNGNSGTTANNFLGTTDNMTFTLRVSDTVAYRMVPAIYPGFGFAPNLISGSDANRVENGLAGATIGGGGLKNSPNVITGTGSFATIGGGGNNTASGNTSTIGGGGGNKASGPYATIGGGESNTASGFYAAINGGQYNNASGAYVAVGGGSGNTANGTYASIGGGWNNFTNGDYVTLSGGYYNTGNGLSTVIGGGYYNTASGPYAAIGGGTYNTASGSSAFIGGGQYNTGSGIGAVVGGGGYNGSTVKGNQAQATASTIGGGYGNVISPTGSYATIGGGANNVASGDSAVLSGGFGNMAIGMNATVGGGLGNTISGTAATVGGGSFNTANGSQTIVGGGIGNMVSGNAATIGGGYYNIASGGDATLSGGNLNTASGNAATISGGHSNTASGTGSVVGGGGADGVIVRGNQAQAAASTISGGYGNVISPTGVYAVIGGGRFNVASGQDAVVAGGANNTASGAASFAAGGYLNAAQGSASFAAGTQAKANHDGAFVWGDLNYSDFSSTAPNQFLVRASGGVTLYTNSAATVGARLAPGSGSWSSVSDRNMKANFQNVEGKDILARLNAIPIETWNYQAQNTAIRHIGPMAQDFYAAFGVGEDDTHISTVDADGVALAAIQGLYRQAQEKDQHIAELEARLARLEQGTPAVSFTWLSVVLVFGAGAIGWLLARRARFGGAK
jgi:hypothetical protein